MNARALRVAAFAFAWAALSAGARGAGAQESPPSGGEPKALPSIHEVKLKNGLSVAHVERAGLPMVTVQVWYRFGSSDEPAGQHGAARVFERLMYMGSERLRPEDHRRFIEQLGGETSALVTEDVSAFHNTVPVERFETALELEAERMRRLMVRADAIDSVRTAMLDDLRRQESSPVFRAYEALLASAFTALPYSWPALGVRADVEKLSAQQSKALYDAYFTPNNALVVVVGGVGAEAAVKAVERWFGPLPKAADPPRPNRGKSEPAQTEPRRQELSGSPIGVMMAGFRLPAASDPDVLAMQVAGMVLTGGTSSRLHRRLVAGKLADDLGGQVLVRHDAGLLVAFATFSSGNAAAVEKAMTTELNRLATQGPTAVELRRAKGQILGAAWFGMESATGLANQIGVSWGLTGKPAGFLADMDALDKMTTAQVRKATAKYMAKNQAVLVVASPGAPGGLSTGGGR